MVHYLIVVQIVGLYTLNSLFKVDVDWMFIKYFDKTTLSTYIGGD